MKKVNYFALCSMFSLVAYGYEISIDNTYNGEVKLTIEQAGPRAKSKEYLLPPNRMTTVETDKIALGPATRCTKTLHFEATSGPAKGHKTSVNPPSTGYDISCRSFTGKNFIRVLKADDNTLVVQVPTPGGGYLYRLINDTDRQVVAHFNLKSGLCSRNPQFLIQPKQTREITMGVCCINSIFFRFTSGEVRKTSKWQSNNKCGSHTLKIKEAQNKDMVVESN